MKSLRITLRISILVTLALLLFSACTSMTVIQTIPPGARIYLNDEICGETPYTMADTKIIGMSTAVRLEMAGYQPFYTEISRTEAIDPGPVVCGLIFTPVWWLWAMKYKPVHTYELVPSER